jgi:hypothetical protein
VRRLGPNLLRGLTIAVFVVAALLALRLGLDDGKPTPETVEKPPGGYTVRDIITYQPTGTVAVRGYFFDGGGTGARLCDRRRPSKPPFCLGPFLDLTGVDESRLPLKHGKSLNQPLRWVEEPVTLYGTVLGTAMTVTDVAR